MEIDPAKTSELNNPNVPVEHWNVWIIIEICITVIINAIIILTFDMDLMKCQSFTDL